VENALSRVRGDKDLGPLVAAVERSPLKATIYTRMDAQTEAVVADHGGSLTACDGGRCRIFVRLELVAALWGSLAPVVGHEVSHLYDYLTTGTVRSESRPQDWQDHIERGTELW
jgi:hypothetical protein